MTTAVCELEAVTKTFHNGRVTAAQDINLTINEGSVVALLGPNGAGKSTVIDMILGLTRPSRGTAKLYGEPPHAAVAAGRVGAVMQSGGLLRDITVLDTVRMIAAAHKNPADPRQVIDEMNLNKLARRRVGRLSGGEQQRLRHALALLTNPDFLILDEPTAGLDPRARHSFWDSARGSAKRGATFLFATHYLEEAEQFADRIILLNQSRIISEGSVAEIKKRAAFTRVSAVVSGSYEPSDLPGGVSNIDIRGMHTVFDCQDSDTLARFLLTETDARDLTVTRSSLDDAFNALVSEFSGSQPTQSSPSSPSAEGAADRNTHGTDHSGKAVD